MIRSGFIYIFLITLLFSCDKKEKDKAANNENVSTGSIQDKTSSGEGLISDAQIIGLLYHRFGENKYPSTSISESLFEDHLQYIKDNNFQVIGAGEIMRILSDPADNGRYVIITIDDAFRSFYTTGFPLLKKYRMKATLFMNTETVGSSDYLTWKEINELVNNGIEIGNHSHSHDYFMNITDSLRSSVFEEDVEKAQLEITNQTGIKPTVFAYPYGEFDPVMQEVVKRLGFSSACAQNSGVMSRYSDRFALPRFPMTDFYGQMDRFREKIKMNALPVKRSVPATTQAHKNPPELILYLEENDLDMERIQCFIQGSPCDFSVDFSPGPVIGIEALTPLTSRRHLYTITVPSKTTKEWYWYSHQWIFPDQQ